MTETSAQFRETQLRQRLDWLRSTLDRLNPDAYATDLREVGENGLRRLYLDGRMDIEEFERYMRDLLRLEDAA